MTLEQALAFAIIGGMMGLFVWGRLRYDLVAVLTLRTSIALGIVPPERAFRGFGDEIVVIVGSALIVSAAVARSGVTESLLGPLVPHLTSVGRQEAVVTAESPLVDHSPSQLGLRERHGVHLLGVSRSGERIEQRLRSVKLRAGDVIALQGNFDFLSDVLGELRCLPLAERGVPLGRDRRRAVPLVVLAVTVTLVSLDLVPLAAAFFGAAIVLLLLRVLVWPLRPA